MHSYTLTAHAQLRHAVFHVPIFTHAELHALLVFLSEVLSRGAKLDSGETRSGTTQSSRQHPALLLITLRPCNDKIVNQFRGRVHSYALVKQQ